MYAEGFVIFPSRFGRPLAAGAASVGQNWPRLRARMRRRQGVTHLKSALKPRDVVRLHLATSRPIKSARRLTADGKQTQEIDPGTFEQKTLWRRAATAGYRLALRGRPLLASLVHSSIASWRRKMARKASPADRKRLQRRKLLFESFRLDKDQNRQKK